MSLISVSLVSRIPQRSRVIVEWQHRWSAQTRIPHPATAT